MGYNDTYFYRYYTVGGQQVPLLDPESRRRFYLRVAEESLVARTHAGVVSTSSPTKAFADPKTIWVVDKVSEDLEYASGYRAQGVTYLDNPDSTEIRSERTPWLDLDWFVPINAQQKV